MRKEIRRQPRKRLPLLLAAAAVVLCLSGLLLPPPSEEKSGPDSFRGDLTGNGKPESFRVRNRRLEIRAGGSPGLLWISPRAWEMRQALLADVDGDGGAELVMVLLKKGSFGPHRPRWHKGFDREKGTHLFVYRWKKGALRPVWCSSAMPRQIVRIRKVPGNRIPEEIVNRSENQKRTFGDGLLIRDRSRLDGFRIPEKGEREALADAPAVWLWDGWGFTRQPAVSAPADRAGGAPDPGRPLPDQSPLPQDRL